MGTMYKEIVARRRTPVVIGIFIGLAIMIVISNFIEQIHVANYNIGFITNPILLMITAIIICIEVFKCKVSYRYSIIADQLIIHKMKDKEQNVVENVKLKNIIFIGKVKELKNNLEISTSKKYTCSVMSMNNYCCVYKDGNQYRKFYFQPSGRMISKIKTAIEE